MATGFIKQMPLSASKFALHELSLPTTIPSSVEPTHRAKIRLIIKPSCFHNRRPHFSPHLQHASIVAKPCKKAVRVLRSVRRKPLASAAHGSKQWKEVGTGGNNGWSNDSNGTYGNYMHKKHIPVNWRCLDIITSSNGHCNLETANC